MEEKSALKLYLSLLDDEIEREIITSISEGLEDDEILKKIIPLLKKG